MNFQTPIAKDTNNVLADRVALVTGASSGIGQAIALALSRQGVRVCIIGRNRAALTRTANAAKDPSRITSFEIDLAVEKDFDVLLRYLQAEGGQLDILVHSAGVIHQDLMEQACVDHFDLQYAVNVRAPYLLTQRMLPLLAAARGQVVFINSSLAHAAKRPNIGQYGATKHALKAIADSLREEVNPKGIRVLSAYLGRTATPMQEALCRHEGHVYRPEILLQCEDVASVIVHALSLPATAEVTDVAIRPMIKG